MLIYTIIFGLFAMWLLLAWINVKIELGFLEKENKVLHDKIQEMYTLQKENVI